MNDEINNLLAIPAEARRAAYKEMRQDLEYDWIHVSPRALRNRHHSADIKMAAGKTAVAERDLDLIESDVASYERKRHLKHLMAVLAGNYDSVLTGENFEFTVRYSNNESWNEEADYIAKVRISEIKGASALA